MDVFALFLLTFLCTETFSGRPTPQCPQIRLRFGRVKYRQKGKMARFLCNTGFVLAGDRFSMCVHGQWDSVPPKCVRPTCKTAKTPANGLIYPALGGAVLNFYCKSHFQLRGSNITYCDGNNWDNPLPACLPTDSTPPLSCDFEHDDICGWNHDLNHDFDWTRMNYGTPSGSIGTGPSHDHTKGAGESGYYMYIESSARLINDTARLISPVYDRTTQNTCFEFYYHMYGATTGDLRVYLKKVTQTWNLNPQNAIFTKNGNQGNRWYRGFVKMGPIDDDFQVVIEGVRGPSYVSDIAIDDVRIILDCTGKDREGEETPTATEEYWSSEAAFTVESCQNRCNTIDNHTDTLLITCDCDEQCSERNRCCPDYIDYCVFFTTDISMEEETLSTTVPNRETPPTVTFTTTRTTTFTPRTTTITPRTTTFTPTTTTFTPTTTTTTPTTTTATTPRTSTNRKPSTTIDDVDEVPLPDSNESEEPEMPVEPEIPDEPQEPIRINQKIVIEPKAYENRTKTVVFVVGVVFGVLFGVVGMAFVARRYRLVRCANLGRIHQSSNGDSQSDVRFLTQDEVLDLNLPTDYDSL